MRIFNGDLKYKKINFKKSKNLRPTRNIVRESFFNTVSDIVKNSIFLDLFAGTGSVGIEAISRGAAKVIFVDSSRNSIAIIKENVDSLNLQNTGIFKMGAKSFLSSYSLNNINLAYIDPPYDFNYDELLNILFDKINKDAIVCIEHTKGITLQNRFKEFRKFKEKSFSKNTLTYFGVING